MNDTGIYPVHIVGGGSASAELRRRVAAAAETRGPVFLCGEAGSGRRTAATVIAAARGFAAAEFVTVNGAAPGADMALARALSGERGGRPRAVYLDRSLSLSPGAAAYLAEALHDASMPAFLIASHPVGPEGLMASARGLKAEVAHRLMSVTVDIPPLRARAEDIGEIARAMVARMRRGADATGVTADAERILVRHSWPGNLRELENVIRTAVALHDRLPITPDMLPAYLHDRPTRASAPVGTELADLLMRPMEEIERTVILHVVEREGGSVPRAARALGLSPSTLYRKFEAWTRKGP